MLYFEIASILCYMLLFIQCLQYLNSIWGIIENVFIGLDIRFEVDFTNVQVKELDVQIKELDVQVKELDVRIKE